MDRPVWEALLSSLKNLNEMGFRRFCSKLCDTQEGQSSSLSLRIENADCEDVVNLIRGTFSYPRGIELAVSILNDINESQVASYLMEYLKKEPRHFVHRHRSDLINRVRVLQPVLDDLLRQHLLTQGQYDSICSKATDQEKMTELYSYVRNWRDGDKDELYYLLTEYNRSLISDLKWQDKMDPPTFRTRHFVDRHCWDLIEHVYVLQPVLDHLLQQNLLTQGQYDFICSKNILQNKMTELYDYVRNWSDGAKDELYDLLEKYNPELISDLKHQDKMRPPTFHTRHFVLRHCWDLINRVRVVQPVLDNLRFQNLLTQGQYDFICRKTTDRRKMGELYNYVRDWRDGDKDELYDLLKKYNPELISHLEHQDMMWPPTFKTRHFVLRHHWDLIDQVYVLQPVLDNLLKLNLLTQGQYDSICSKTTDRRKMSELYRHVRDWRDGDKDKLYDLLKLYNPELISDLERQDKMRSPTFHSQKFTEDGGSGAETSSLVDMSSNPKPSSQESTDVGGSGAETSNPVDMSSNPKPTEQTSEQVSIRDHCLECRLCGKAQYKATVLVPETIEFERSYRLKIEYPGFFRCNYTGIQFLVSDAVIIEYTLESWFIYFSEFQKNGYKIAGPLFNIKTDGESDKILELYLPHHLCLHGITEQDVQIKCAHFTDENLLLETPAKIEPFYVVLLKPKFSLWGPIQWILGKKTPVHANVLTYFRVLCMDDPENRAYRIHLYLLSAPFLNEQALNRRKSSFMFQKMDKPPQTLHSMYADTNYDVQGEPDVHVVPKVLQIDTSYLSVESLPFTEINFKQNEISIQVLHQDNTVWQAFVLKEDIRDFLKGKHERKQNESFPKSVHFVLEHREALIQRLPMVEPILDELHAQNILTDEAYETVSNEGTTQMKVRKLFKFVRSWGRREMDVLLEALRKHQSPLIEDLERSSSEESEE